MSQRLRSGDYITFDSIIALAKELNKESGVFFDIVVVFPKSAQYEAHTSNPADNKYATPGNVVGTTTCTTWESVERTLFGLPNVYEFVQDGLREGNHSSVRELRFTITRAQYPDQNPGRFTKLRESLIGKRRLMLEFTFQHKSKHGYSFTLQVLMRQK